jgi:hypothetical protein
MLRARLEMSPSQWKRFCRLLELSESDSDFFLMRKGTEFWMTERVEDLSSGELIAKRCLPCGKARCACGSQ